MLARVRPELLVELLVAALADQVQIEFADRRQERVRVIDRVRTGRAVVDAEPVAERQLGAIDHPLEHSTGVNLLELGGRTAVGLDRDALGRRAQYAHDHAAILAVCAEDAVGIGVLTSDQRVEL